MTRARYDGYLASQTKLTVRQVLCLYGHRAVVMEEFADRNQWNAERLDSNRGVKAAAPGNVLLGGKTSDGQTEPPRAGFFYGVNWLPE